MTVDVQRKKKTEDIIVVEKLHEWLSWSCINLIFKYIHHIQTNFNTFTVLIDTQVIMSFIGSIILILSSSFVSPVRAYDGSIMKVAGEYFYRVESLTPQSTDCRSSFASDLKWAIVSVATARECSKVCIRNYTWCLAFKILDAYVNKVCVVAEIGEDTYHNCYPYYRVPGIDCYIYLVILVLEDSS